MSPTFSAKQEATVGADTKLLFMPKVSEADTVYPSPILSSLLFALS
jgi:hypothetical protein